jgi:hypothetical protein
VPAAHAQHPPMDPADPDGVDPLSSPGPRVFRLTVTAGCGVPPIRTVLRLAVNHVPKNKASSRKRDALFLTARFGNEAVRDVLPYGPVFPQVKSRGHPAAFVIGDKLNADHNTRIKRKGGDGGRPGATSEGSGNRSHHRLMCGPPTPTPLSCGMTASDHLRNCTPRALPRSALTPFCGVRSECIECLKAVATFYNNPS